MRLLKYQRTSTNLVPRSPFQFTEGDLGTKSGLILNFHSLKQPARSQGLSRPRPKGSEGWEIKDPGDEVVFKTRWNVYIRQLCRRIQ